MFSLEEKRPLTPSERVKKWRKELQQLEFQYQANKKNLEALLREDEKLSNE